MSEITTRAEEGAKLYVLMKRGLYWRPDAQGYTGVLADAGRYTAEKAAAYTHHDDPSVTAILADEADEFSPACWEETKLARRDKQLAAAESRAASAEAEVERLKGLVEDWKATAEAEAEIGNERAATAQALKDRVAVLESALKEVAACPLGYDDGTQSYNVTELFRMVKAIATAALNGCSDV